MIRVLLVDDDPLVVLGMRLLLGGEPDLVVVGDASDGDELVAAVERHCPDVVLLDIRMTRVDGVAALRELRAIRPDTPAVIVLTTFRTDAVVLEALRGGAAGFLLKHETPERIVGAVRRAAEGEATVSPGILQQLIDHVAADARHDPADPLAGLSVRERGVALAVADGLGNGDIAGRLFLSVGSVKSHVSTALAKLGLDNRVQLAIAAHESRSRGF